MALRRNPPRANRPSSFLNSTHLSWFPDIKDPQCPIQSRINTLNREAFLSDIFARADDLLMYTLFAKKGRKRRHHSVVPQPAQSGNATPLSKEHGILAASLCRPLFSGNTPSWDAILHMVDALQHDIPLFRSPELRWSHCLAQYVLSSSSSFFLIHSFSSLLFRYSLLYSSGSSVRILKVTHTGHSASFGLKATRPIASGEFIMETCSSMSLDSVSTPGPSIIQSSSHQLGPHLPRLILGPFRFVNHDCSPNSQVSFSFLPFLPPFTYLLFFHFRSIQFQAHMPLLLLLSHLSTLMMRLLSSMTALATMRIIVAASHVLV
jgi:hypothetical protein